MKAKEITFWIIIYKFSTVLHSSEYVFKTRKEANAYGYGIYKGYELSGMNPSGVTINRLKND